MADLHVLNCGSGKAVFGKAELRKVTSHQRVSFQALPGVERGLDHAGKLAPQRPAAGIRSEHAAEVDARTGREVRHAARAYRRWIMAVLPMCWTEGCPGLALASSAMRARLPSRAF